VFHLASFLNDILVQALKQFTSGSSHGSGGGSSQTKLVSMAMTEASKLFDSKQTSSGNKQDAVNGAAMMVMKLMVQSKLGGMTGGGNSGGLSSLMSLVSLIFEKNLLSEQ
jgi:hypothetical protein